MRTMKNVKLDKLTHKYLQKKVITVAEAKELSYDTMIEMNIPKIVRDNIVVMGASQTLESTIREGLKLSQQEIVEIELPTYDPVVEEKVAAEVTADVVTEYTDHIVEEVTQEAPVVEEVLVEEIVEEVAPVVYTEEEIRRVFESTELAGSYTNILKKVKPLLSEKGYDAEMLITLAKEYAAKLKK